MSYRWIITKDHFDGDGDGNAVGVEGPGGCDSSMKDNPVRFSLWTDDQECMAEGMLYMADDAYEVHSPEEVVFSPLDNFGTPNWGCTAIKHNGEFI